MRTLSIALALALLIAAACADNLPDAPRNIPTDQATEMSAAASRLQGWQNRLTNARLEIKSQVHTTEPPIEVEAISLITPDLFYYSLESLFGDEPGAPRLRFESLSTGGAAYSRWYGVDGWLRLPLDRWTHDAGFTAGLEAVANLSWAQLDDVQITRGEWQGRPIWLVEYDADRVDLFQYPDLISPLATGLNGAPTVLFSYDSLRAVVRLSIDRESGAPLLTETRQWFDGSGGEDETEIASTITLRAWNAPLDPPSPQPVLAPDEYWAQVAAARPGRTLAAQIRRDTAATDRADARLAPRRRCPARAGHPGHCRRAAAFGAAHDRLRGGAVPDAVDAAGGIHRGVRREKRQWHSFDEVVHRPPKAGGPWPGCRTKRQR